MRMLPVVSGEFVQTVHDMVVAHLDRQRRDVRVVDRARLEIGSRHAFYQAANGVWLTDRVPPGNLSGWLG